MTTDAATETFAPSEIERMLDSGEFEFKNGQLVKIGGLEGEGVVHDVESVVLWDRRSREPSTVRLYSGNQTLMKMLAKKDRDPQSPTFGQRIFTTSRPSEAPMRGSVPCYFNPKSPRYDEFRAMGFPECSQDSLPNEEEVHYHVKNRHSRAFDTITRKDAELKEQAKADREQATSEAILAAVTALAGGEPKRGPGRPKKEAPEE